MSLSKEVEGVNNRLEVVKSSLHRDHFMNIPMTIYDCVVSQIKFPQMKVWSVIATIVFVGWLVIAPTLIIEKPITGTLRQIGYAVSWVCVCSSTSFQAHFSFLIHNSNKVEIVNNRMKIFKLFINSPLLCFCFLISVVPLEAFNFDVAKYLLVKDACICVLGYHVVRATVRSHHFPVRYINVICSFFHLMAALQFGVCCLLVVNKNSSLARLYYLAFSTATT